MFLHKTILSLVLASGLLWSGLAAAEVPDGTRVDVLTVKSLMSWVERETGYRIATTPIVVASQQKFDAILEAKGAHYADARAVYIPGMVVLDNATWDPGNPVEVSLLVHELVHHAQLYAKRNYPCPDAREYEAYSLQNKWLIGHGYAPFASQAWIDQMSGCRGGGNFS